MRQNVALVDSLSTANGKLAVQTTLGPDGGRLMRARGIIDSTTHGELRDFLGRHLVRPVPRVDLDLGDVACLTLTGAAVLVGAQHRAGLRGVELRLTNPSQAVRAVLGHLEASPVARTPAAVG